jgi:alpha-glucosidase
MNSSVHLRKWFFLLLLFCTGQAFAQQYNVTSPNGLLKMDLDVSSIIQYEVTHGENVLITPSAISLTLNTGLVLGKNAVVSSTERRSVNESIERIYGKNASLSDHFNELKIIFTENYSLIVRAYDEGIAYRFVTDLGGEVIVEAEEASFNFEGTPGVIFPEADGAMQSWERAYYTYESLEQIAAGRFSITPTMFTFASTGMKVVVAEADLFDYPGMYLQRDATNDFKGKWAQYPKTVSDPDDIYKYHRVLSRESYLAKTSGTRQYPWRVVIVSTDDKDLLNNELIYKLATPSVLTSTTWIKPGKSVWEWWHDAILETTQIPSGPNNLSFNLYKYYIDFAAQYNIEYLTMDAGWSTSYAAQVCQYAATKNVKVFAWDFINLPIENPARLTELKNIGFAGVKIDLIERDDQIAINWFEQLAQDCAERGLMIIFHGCAKPTGLQRTYPNIVNFEAVRGAECNKWDQTANPTYHVQFPFIRMLAGPLDYTPGSMRNVHQSEFTPIGTGIPKSMGTRAHEMAMYVMFDQPLGYFCDSPTEYRKFSDVMTFLSKVPTDWDQTLPLSASVGEYAVIARKKGEEWYVGAMTNSAGRDVEIDFSFLGAGEDKSAEVFRDIPATASNARAYTREIITVNNQSKVTFHLEPEGGLAIRVGEMITATDKSEAETGIHISQDPEGNRLVIKSASDIRFVTIFDVSGRTFYHNAPQGRKLASEVSTESLKRGMYIVTVETRTSMRAVKFLR